MNQIVTAIYADGVLRPLAPLDLPEQTEVEIEVKPVARMNGAADSAIDERARIHQILVASGLVLERQQLTPSPPISEEERKRLGLIFSVGKPLSEIIIEEREENF